MALAAEAQAVAIAELGPRRPQRIETWPLAGVDHQLGDGERADPRRPLAASSIACWVSNSLRPPIPEPMMTPQASGG